MTQNRQYPSIPTDKCIQRISNWLSQQNISTKALEVITEALVIVLKNNRVVFGDPHAIQDKGIDTCTGPAAAIANLFLGISEEDNLSPELLAFLPFTKRYIDGGFVVWKCSPDPVTDQKY